MDRPRFSETETSSYIIPKEQFQTSGTNLQEATRYIFPNKVNRDNFTSFYIESFRISRGIPAVQYLYMEWLKLHTGFDYVTTLRNVQEAGGWNVLSSPEQDMFMNAIRKVSEHFVKGGAFEGEEPLERNSLARNFESPLNDLCNEEALAEFESELPKENFIYLQKNDFLSAINNFIIQDKLKRL